MLEIGFWYDWPRFPQVTCTTAGSMATQPCRRREAPLNLKCSCGYTDRVCPPPFCWSRTDKAYARPVHCECPSDSCLLDSHDGGLLFARPRNHHAYVLLALCVCSHQAPGMRGTLRGGSYLLALASLALVSATVSGVKSLLMIASSMAWES